MVLNQAASVGSGSGSLWGHVILFLLKILLQNPLLSLNLPPPASVPVLSPPIRVPESDLASLANAGCRELACRVTNPQQNQEFCSDGTDSCTRKGECELVGAHVTSSVLPKGTSP